MAILWIFLQLNSRSSKPQFMPLAKKRQTACLRVSYNRYSIADAPRVLLLTVPSMPSGLL